MAKGKKTGGRSKGTPNKATRDIKELAQDYGDKAVATLAEIMGDAAQPAAARVAAADKLLDRGYGKAAQAIAVSGTNGGPITSIQATLPADPVDAARVYMELMQGKP